MLIDMLLPRCFHVQLSLQDVTSKFLCSNVESLFITKLIGATVHM